MNEARKRDAAVWREPHLLAVGEVSDMGAVRLELQMPRGSWLRVDTTAPMPTAVWLWETRRRLLLALAFVEAVQTRVGVMPAPPDRSASYTTLCSGGPGVAMPDSAGEAQP